MGSFSDDDEEGEYQFFDAPDSISQISDICSRIPKSIDNDASYQYDMWVRTPRSVGERRRKFLSRMSLSVDGMSGEDPADLCRSSEFDFSTGEIERIMESSGAVLRSSIFKDELSSYQSGLCGEALGSSENLGSNGHYLCRSGNVDSGVGCSVHAEAENGQQSNNRAVRLERLLVSRELDNSPCMSPVIGKLGQGGLHKNGDSPGKLNGVKSRLLSRLRSFTCVANGEGRSHDSTDNSSDLVQRSRTQRVKVRHCRKQLKELSALFMGQDIQAHEGSILTMKFSFDGQYLASAGEDKIVRVWKVVEDERSNEIDIPELDPSCMYFTVNHLSQLAPLATEKDRITKLKGLMKTTDSACVIFPPKVFRILEKPLHVFQGHTGEILDLSWSKNNQCLLSSSTDKTVRLWKIGHDLCLRVFSHSNYVTCIQFNPVNDECFISGSIDGKVRIWAVNSCQVLDWTDIKDIVTAVSYRPDGQGGIIGSMAGTCRFFNVEGHEIHLEEQMCLANKKKSICKRITGFQYLPQDPSKVMVTSADSHVRILDGVNVISKYKGQRNAGNHLSATFTSDGKHIISASEDSNVYVWNCDIRKDDYVSQPKVVRSSEFFSSDVSIAIPWSGLKTVNPDNGWHSGGGLSQTPNSLLPFMASPYLSLGRELFLEAIPKGSATWPEEKLPVSSPRSVSSRMCRSEYKLLKSSCQSSSNSHAWGLVIVTASYDGRIRSFHNYGLPLPL